MLFEKFWCLSASQMKNVTWRCKSCLPTRNTCQWTFSVYDMGYECCILVHTILCNNVSISKYGFGFFVISVIHLVTGHKFMLSLLWAPLLLINNQMDKNCILTTTKRTFLINPWVLHISIITAVLLFSMDFNVANMFGDMNKTLSIFQLVIYPHILFLVIKWKSSVFKYSNVDTKAMTT